MELRVIDVEDALDRVQDDKELLLELFDIFQDDFEEKYPVLKDVSERGEAEEVRNLAHALKGAAGNISAQQIHKTCGQIEGMANDDVLDGVDELLTTLFKQFGAFVREADKLRALYKN